VTVVSSAELTSTRKCCAPLATGDYQDSPGLAATELFNEMAHDGADSDALVDD
jgi:hypothetical protein